MPRLQVAFKTEKGKDSAPEEKDSFFFKDNLFIVVEGVNGDYLGEMLKEKVCNGLASSFFKHLSKERAPGMALVSALREINEEIIHERKRAGRKMAASVSVSYILGRVMYFSHLGDSRIYCLHKGEIVQLTKDHTVGEESALGEMTGLDRRLLRALTDGLGVREKPDIKVKTFALGKKDIILMTTEGLTRYLSNMQIQKLSQKAGSPKDLSTRLIEEAKRKGAQSSMTLGIIRYRTLPQLLRGGKALSGVAAAVLILGILGFYLVRDKPSHGPPVSEKRVESQPTPKKGVAVPSPGRRGNPPKTPGETVPKKSSQTSAAARPTETPPAPTPSSPKTAEVPKEAPSKRPAPTYRQEIQGFLNEWKAAWERTAGDQGDMGKYLSLYADDFSSQGKDKNAWRKEKGEINRKKSWIRIELRDVSMGEPMAGNRVEVRFLQDYKSSNFSGSSKKVLLLRKTDPGWRIVQEKSG
jgi:protein phosphatase